jgi:branched-chain amino acid transport system substrate-binding protein
MRRRQVLAAAAGLAVVPAARAQTGEIRLGAIYPFSGPLALLGDESFRGLELAAEEANAAGGIGGARLRLIRADAADAGQAAAEARRLVGQERVQAVFGTHASTLSLAATQVTDAAGVPYFELGAVADAVTERGLRTVFRSAPPARAYGEVAFDAIAAVAAKAGIAARLLRIAILREEGVLGSAISAAQKARAAELGLAPVEDLPYSMRATDLLAAVQRLRDAGAEVVLHTGYQHDIVLFYRAMRQVGWKPRAVVGTGGDYALTETQKAVGQEFQNTMAVDVTPMAANESVAPGVRPFAEAYARRFGHPPRSGHSLSNYTGARIFLDVLGRAGSADKDRVRAAVLAADAPAHTCPNGWGVRFDDTGQNLRARPFVLQWQVEQPVTVLPAEAAVSTLRLGLGGS